jgi:predicted amidophosphoribosyltransferase
MIYEPPPIRHDGKCNLCYKDLKEGENLICAKCEEELEADVCHYPNCGCSENACADMK